MFLTIISFLALPIAFFNLYVADNSFFNNYEKIKMPEPVVAKGIYWTAYTAGFKKRRDELIDLIDRTELNSVVIDLKDSTGKVFFDFEIELVKETDAEDLRIPDLPDLMQELKKRDIYTIARIAVFQDPNLAEKKPELALKRADGSLWRDWKGLAWVDSSSPAVWKYNVDVAKAAINLGFSEVNFDYIRFPSDGPLSQIVYPFHEEGSSKTEVIQNFFAYLSEELKYYPAYISVDLFGMVLWRDDGFGIGQRYQDAAPFVDYICPMVYPSHYPAGFENFENPAAHPYEIVYRSLIRGNENLKDKRAKLRPWLQDFDLGAVYTPELIKLQKQATYDSGWDGWTLWNASNQYTVGGLELTTEVAK